MLSLVQDYDYDRAAGPYNELYHYWIVLLGPRFSLASSLEPVIEQYRKNGKTQHTNYQNYWRNSFYHRHHPLSIFALRLS